MHSSFDLGRSSDGERLIVHEAMVQSVPLSFFRTLGVNDILFIDSSHVLKLGNDVAFLLIDVLPRLRSGVVGHVHDISRSFEYPVEWYDGPQQKGLTRLPDGSHVTCISPSTSTRCASRRERRLGLTASRSRASVF